MQIHISPYTEKSKGSVKQSISKLLDSHNTEREARDAFSYHFQDARSFAFQRYYNETVANREGFLSTLISSGGLNNNMLYKVSMGPT